VLERDLPRAGAKPVFAARLGGAAWRALLQRPSEFRNAPCRNLRFGLPHIDSHISQPGNPRASTKLNDPGPIARQGRQIFRKKQFRLYGGCRVEIDRGNARDRLGMDHCIRRQQVRSADQAEVSRMAETARSSGSGSSQPSGRPPRPAARPHHCERRSASRPPWRRSLWPPW
jgi:hypothetical protein